MTADGAPGRPQAPLLLSRREDLNGQLPPHPPPALRGAGAEEVPSRLAARIYGSGGTQKTHHLTPKREVTRQVFTPQPRPGPAAGLRRAAGGGSPWWPAAATAAPPPRGSGPGLEVSGRAAAEAVRRRPRQAARTLRRRRRRPPRLLTKGPFACFVGGSGGGRPGRRLLAPCNRREREG